MLAAVMVGMSWHHCGRELSHRLFGGEAQSGSSDKHGTIDGRAYTASGQSKQDVEAFRACSLGEVLRLHITLG